MGENYNTGAKVLLSISSEAERTAGTSPGKSAKEQPKFGQQLDCKPKSTAE